MEPRSRIAPITLRAESYVDMTVTRGPNFASSEAALTLTRVRGPYYLRGTQCQRFPEVSGPLRIPEGSPSHPPKSDPDHVPV